MGSLIQDLDCGGQIVTYLLRQRQETHQDVLALALEFPRLIIDVRCNPVYPCPDLTKLGLSTTSARASKPSACYGSIPSCGAIQRRRTRFYITKLLGQ
jgi:hypothetical protein